MSLGGCEWWSHSGKQVAAPQNAGDSITVRPSNSSPRHQPQKTESLHPQMFMASLFTTAKKWKWSKCASADGRGTPKPPVRTAKGYSAIRSSEAVTHYNTGGSENMLSESQTQKVTSGGFHLHKMPGTGKKNPTHIGT